MTELQRKKERKKEEREKERESWTIQLIPGICSESVALFFRCKNILFAHACTEK
jgi:hypothetical protein